MYSEVGSTKLTGADANARRIGDLITVLVEENTSTKLDASTNVSHKSNAVAEIKSLLGLESSITKANPNMGGSIKLGGGHENSTNGAGDTAQTSAIAATLTCTVQEVLPNGNLRIRGNMQVRVNREIQFVTLVGVIRPRDIQLNNTIRSSLLADKQVEFAGQGVISSQQRQAWGNAVINAVSPF